MLSLGSNTTITGLRLRGYNQRDREARKDQTTAIYIPESEGVTIENNELFGWPRAGVYIAGSPDWTGSGPHGSRGTSCTTTSSATSATALARLRRTGLRRIDRNVFNYNRHDVAGRGDPGEGYTATLNLHLTSGPKCDPGRPSPAPQPTVRHARPEEWWDGWHCRVVHGDPAEHDPRRADLLPEDHEAAGVLVARHTTGESDLCGQRRAPRFESWRQGRCTRLGRPRHEPTDWVPHTCGSREACDLRQSSMHRHGKSARGRRLRRRWW